MAKEKNMNQDAANDEEMTVTLPPINNLSFYQSISIICMFKLSL